VTCHDVEHPHAIGRRLKAGLTLVGAATAAVLALAAGSPEANADPRSEGSSDALLTGPHTF
jgi:hypothetical protein